MTSKALITGLVILLAFAALQLVAWFVAVSFGYQFGTENYGPFAAIAACFAAITCPAIIITRHTQ